MNNIDIKKIQEYFGNDTQMTKKFITHLQKEKIELINNDDLE